MNDSHRGFVEIHKNSPLVISGEGLRGRVIRVYLYPSDNIYSLTLEDENKTTYNTLSVNRILYFKLKNSRRIIIENEGNGSAKVM